MSRASVCSDAAAVILSVCKRLPFQRDRGKARGRRRRSHFSSHHWFPWALDGALLSLCAICSGFGWKASPGRVWADGFAPVLPEATTAPSGRVWDQRGRCCLQEFGCPECWGVESSCSPSFALGTPQSQPQSFAAQRGTDRAVSSFPQLQLLSSAPRIGGAVISPPWLLPGARETKWAL